MTKPIDFFGLQLEFAHKVAEVSHHSFEEALLGYTNLYIRFGLGRDFDATNPAWQAYLKGLRQTDDELNWTYRFCVDRHVQAATEPAGPAFGCFSYSVWPGDRLRLHFHNAETSRLGPLSRDRMSSRLEELAALFEAVRAHLPEIRTIVGGSWLYNIDAYRRLFPPAFLATAVVSEADFRYFPLWGQFLNSRGKLKVHRAAGFLRCLQVQHNMEGIEDCFPFPVLYLECAVHHFFEFYLDA